MFLKLRSLLISTLFVAVAAVSGAQIAAPEVFASAGSGGLQSFTIGEVFTAAFESGQPQLTQGFHQVVQVADFITSEEQLGVNVYPNPANAYLNVDMPSQSGEWNWALHDLRGRRIAAGVLTHPAQILLSDISRGVYTFTIRKQSTSALNTFRIVKLDL